MIIDAYLKQSNFIEKSELERAKLLAFYLHQIDNQPTVTIKEICNLLYVHGFTQPDKVRLEQNMVKSKSFVQALEEGTFRLQESELDDLKKQFPQIDSSLEEADDSILPENLYLGTRDHIEQLANQINACYHYQLFDGTSLLMRRLLEVLLTLTYDYLGRRSEIEDSNGIKSLATIIQYTQAHEVIAISSDAQQALEELSCWGNFNTSKIMYNTRKSDIDTIRVHFRVVVKELLYRSEIK